MRQLRASSAPSKQSTSGLLFPTVLETLEAGVQDYVLYYNHERIKLRLNGLSPVGYWLRNTA
uniref:IS3 family transposase n=1 Tax=Acidovorax sp. DW039 TaxID=3095606 RepID=UPI00403F9B12